MRPLYAIAIVTALGAGIALRTPGQPATRPASQPATAPSPRVAKIRALLDDLSSPQFARRDAAQTKLLNFGRAAKPHLEELARSTTEPEVLARVDVMLDQIAGQFEPTLVSLHVSDASALKALGMIEAQVPFAVAPLRPDDLRRARDARVTIDADDQPFWSVLTRVCGPANLRPEASLRRADSLPVSGTYGGMSSAFTSVHGPFAITARAATVNVSVSFADPARPTQGASIELVALVEPGLVPLFWERTEIDRCTDEEGADVPTTVGERRDGAWQDTERVQVVPKASRSLKRLSGKAVLAVQAGFARARFTDLGTTNDVVQMVGANGVAFRGLRKKGESEYTAVMSAYRDGRDDAAWADFRRAAGAAHPMAFDRLQNPLIQWTRGQPANKGNHVDVEFSFLAGPTDGRAVAAGAPHRIQWDVPTDVRRIDVPFDFVDLPLP